MAVAGTWSQFALQSVNVQADRVGVAGTWSQFALQSVNVQADRVAVAGTWSQFALQSVNVQADRVAVAGTWSQFALQSDASRCACCTEQRLSDASCSAACSATCWLLSQSLTSTTCVSQLATQHNTPVCSVTKAMSPNTIDHV